MSSSSETRTEVDPRERPTRPHVVTTAQPPSGDSSMLRQMHSNASLSAISAQVATPSTPALTPGGASAATDDEETDFQSAYSASPRGSYVESGDDAALDGEYDEQGTPTKIVGLHPHDHLDEFGAHDAQLLAPPPKPPKARERNFSTSTATNARVHRLQQRGSEDTVGGRA